MTDPLKTKNKLCKTCSKTLSWYESVYCSNKCQLQSQYEAYIKGWKTGELSGSRGINTRNISKHIQRYLLEKFGEKCTMCGWGEKNPVTNKVPLEIDHIDGNSENNLETNLRLICPNCHSLSPNFRNLNRGRGRKWRNEKAR